MAIDTWAWAAQDRYPGFSLTYIQGRAPDVVAAALGADQLRVMTSDDAARAFPINERGSLLRCGQHGDWTFCFEEREHFATREAATARLSAGTRMLQVTKGGDGMNLVLDVHDGHTIEAFEPGFDTPARGEGPRILQPAVEAVLAAHPGILGLVAALAVVGDTVGIALDRAALDGPLLTDLSTLAEPATIRRSSTTSPPGLRRLGRIR